MGKLPSSKLAKNVFRNQRTSTGFLEHHGETKTTRPGKFNKMMYNLTQEGRFPKGLKATPKKSASNYKG